jgi:hypothetical protein
MDAPRFDKRSVDDSEKVKIAAIDPDFVLRPFASVPDGIGCSAPYQYDGLYAHCLRTG